MTQVNLYSASVRRPVVAGQFYPDNPQTLQQEAMHYLQQGAHVAADNGLSPTKATIVMLPHAGYYYCGEVIGNTLAQIQLPSTLILLGPNHTGLGAPLAVWPNGVWQTPLGPVPVNEALATALIDGGCAFSADGNAHSREHSLEVLLPFLQCYVTQLQIVPVCVGIGDMQILESAGRHLGAVVQAYKDHGEEVGILISSDMNHFADHDTTVTLDAMALRAALALDPDALRQVVTAHKISMCGVCPAIMAIYAAHVLGVKHTRQVSYKTSGDVSGDNNRVVGYAGWFAW